MYNILIVDDSTLDIECITFLIDKYRLPLHAVTAVNGQEALAICRNSDKPFDILFTDIKMPLMDGLALSREVRLLTPGTRIVIFSGFNEFEYAKTAITIGVMDYLLKPIIPEDFAALMQSLIRSIEEQQRQEERLAKQHILARNHLLWQSVNQEDTADTLLLRREYSHVMLLECNNEIFHKKDLDIERTLNDLLPFSFDYLNLYPTRSILFIKPDKEHTYKTAHLLSAAQAVSLYMQEEYEARCYITFDALEGEASIYAVCQRLEQKLESRFFFPDQNILLPWSSGQFYSTSGQISLDMIVQDLKIQDFFSLTEHLDDLFASLTDSQSYSLIYVKYCFTELTKEILRYLPGRGFSIHELADQIYTSVNILDLCNMTRSLTALLPEVSGQDKHVNNHLKLEAIKKYIYQNYKQPLTLEEIASAFYLSPNYLCSVFKKESGVNLMKFINDYRLQRARELLITTSMKVNRIAEEVGFHNTSYFCQRFRDSYGVSPESFRHKESLL